MQGKGDLALFTLRSVHFVLSVSRSCSSWLSPIHGRHVAQCSWRSGLGTEKEEPEGDGPAP